MEEEIDARHIAKKGSKYHPVVELGVQGARRCEGCGKRLGWVSEGTVDSCTKCGATELVERQERRQKWLQGHSRKKDAQAALAAVVAETNHRGSYLEPSRECFSDYLTSTWLPAIKSTIRPGTFLSYSQTVSAHIVPALGHHELRHLSPEKHLNPAYAKWLEQGRARDGSSLSPATVAHIHVVISRALRDAQRWSLVSRNVAALADPPQPKRSEMKIWSAEQIAHFLSFTNDDRLGPLYAMLFLTGLRRGGPWGSAGRMSISTAGACRSDRRLSRLGT